MIQVGSGQTRLEPFECPTGRRVCGRGRDRAHDQAIEIVVRIPELNWIETGRTQRGTAKVARFPNRVSVFLALLDVEQSVEWGCVGLPERAPVRISSGDEGRAAERRIVIDCLDVR